LQHQSRAVRYILKGKFIITQSLRLYEDGIESYRKRKQLNGRTAEQLGCTFKPRINNSRKDNSRAGIKSSDSRFDRLYKTAEARRVKNEKLKQKLEQQETPSFTPSITRLGRDQESTVNRFEKLYMTAIDSQRQSQIDSYIDPECTFEPRLVSKSKKADLEGQKRLEALYLHAKDIDRKRQIEVEKRDEHLTFKPHTNKTGLKSPRGSLYPSKVDQQNKARRLQAVKAHLEMQGCTFTPKRVNKRRDGNDDDDAKSCPDVHSRLYQQSITRNLSRTERSSCSVSSGVTVTNNEVFNRLYKGGKQSMEKRSALEKQAKERKDFEEWERNKNDCTFAPQITTRAISADRTTNSFDRLHLDSIERMERRLNEYRKAVDLDLCYNFKPRILQHSRDIVDQKRKTDQFICSPTKLYLPNRLYLPLDERQIASSKHSEKENDESNLKYREAFHKNLLEYEMTQKEDTKFRISSW